MKTQFLTLLFPALILIAGAVVQAEEAETMLVAQVGESAPGFTLVDATGEEHSLSDYEGKYIVLEWVNFGCPFVRKYYDAGEMQKLQANYREKDVVWLTICSSAEGKQGYFEGDDLTAQLDKEKIKATAYLIDESGEVGMMYQAKTTPNMYVIDPEGTLIYAGAIDDKPTPKQADLDGATNYVVEALKADMAGKEVATPATQPYGCSVKYAKK